MALHIGGTRVDSVLEFQGPYRLPGEMYPDCTADLVDRHRGWMEPRYLDAASGQMVFAFRSFLIRTSGLTILVDSCVGNDKNRPHRELWHRQNFPWMDNLQALGVTPEEIDLVMCTHLHVDHIGWNTRLENGRWVPTFPKAKYLFQKTEYDFWEAEHRRQDWITDAFEDSVLPVVSAGQALMVESDYEIGRGLRIEPSPGHTPGHVSLNLESEGECGVFCGDLMHHPLQVPEPQLYSIFCSDPTQSCATRTAFLDRHGDTDTIVLPAHFPGPDSGGGRIVSGADGRAVFEPVD